MKSKTQIILCQILFILAVIFASCSNEKNKHIVVKFDKGDDLIKGDIVTLNGLDIGVIESVELNQKYEACALVKINTEIKIPKDSRFIIDNESFFSTGLKVEPGNSKIFLQNSDTIKGVRYKNSKEDQIIEVINELTGKADFVKHQDSILLELKKLNFYLDELESLDTTIHS